MDRPPSVMGSRRRRRGSTNSLVSSAALISGRGAPPTSAVEVGGVKKWQKEAWSFFETCGEFRAAVTWISNSVSRVNLLAAEAPRQLGDEPAPMDATQENHAAVEAVREIGGGPAGQAEVLFGAARNLSVAGEGYVYAPEVDDAYDEWRVAAGPEVKKGSGGGSEIMDKETGKFVAIGELDLFLKLWRGSPTAAHEPDAPARGVLGPMREIAALSNRVIADSQSRLTGNGILLLPEEAEFPMSQPAAALLTPHDEDDIAEGTDQFIEALIATAQAAPLDPTSPAAVIPIIARMPAEVIEHVKHIDLASAYDKQIDTLRSSAIRRLALGMDIPPEVILGLGDMNHWNGWLTAESTITTQIEPLAELICNAFTRHYLWPALQARDVTDYRNYLVWYDTADLTSRPDMSKQAVDLWDRNLISDTAARRLTGIGDEDKIDDAELLRRLIVGVIERTDSGSAIALLDWLKSGAKADLPEVSSPIEIAAPAEPDEADEPDGPPDPPDDPPGQAQTASAVRREAMIEAVDALMARALEVGGARLRNAIGRGQPGGAATVTAPTERLHIEYDATKFTTCEAMFVDAYPRAALVAARYGLNTDALVSAMTVQLAKVVTDRRDHDRADVERAVDVALLKKR